MASSSAMSSVTALFLLLLPRVAPASATFQATAPASATAATKAGPCDILAAAANECVAAHSTVRALYSSYAGPLYQVGGYCLPTRVQWVCAVMVMVGTDS